MLKRIFLFLTLFVLMTGLFPVGQSTLAEAAPQAEAVPQADAADEEPQSSPSQCYLPFSNNQGCIEQNIESPFSLQIAAEHQLQAPPAGDFAGADLSSQTLEAQLEAQARVDASYSYLVDALKDSGAAWTRLFVMWKAIEPDAPVEGQPPAYKWTYYDNKFKIVANTGLRIIMTVANSPTWAARYSCAPIYSDRLDEYARFLTDLVNHYKQPPYNVRHWEIVNEPDYIPSNTDNNGLGCWGNNARDYVDTLAVAYSAIKAADPEATVLMGGIAHDWFADEGGFFNRYFPDHIMEFNAGQYMDTFTFHYFPDFRLQWERWNQMPDPTCGNAEDGIGARYEAGGIDIVAKTTHLRNRMKTCYGFNKPFWLTELAEHGYPGYPDWLDRQARYVIQGHIRALSAGITNITWYALVTVNDRYHQGLLYDDWTPKPAFTSYRTLTAELKNYRYKETRALNDGELYVFETTCGKEKLVAWSSAETLVAVQGQQAETIDYMGNTQTLQDGGAGDADGAVNNSISVRVTAPVFIEVTQPVWVN